MNQCREKEFTFNSPFETGLRSICILAADDSIEFDLQQLLAFDHLVVHSGDIQNAPSSLHPKVSKRNGELLVRRAIVERGLLLMESKKLVRKKITKDGFYYSATELAVVLIESLSNDYMIELYKISKWAVQTYKNYGDLFFAEVFNTAFDRWSHEFQIAEITLGQTKGISQK